MINLGTGKGGIMIYFDQAATTKPYEEAVRAASECMMENWANPSSRYEIAVQSHNTLEQCRKIIADSINSNPENIVFTSGSTEAINWFARSLQGHPVYITKMEHAAVRKSVINPKYIPIDRNMLPITKAIPEQRIALMTHVNNEIGSILPIKGLLDRKTILALDATQSYGHIPIDVKQTEIAFIIASAHKLHGIRGAGFIYISDKALSVVKDYPLQKGGGQELGMRAGTENLPGIVAMAMAAKQSLYCRNLKNKSIANIRDYLYEQIRQIPCAHLNGTSNWSKRWCGNLNFRFDGYKGDELQTWLSEHEIYVGTGSACSSKENKPSHVLKGAGLSTKQANSSLRFTFDETNTLDEAKELVKVLKDGLETLKK